MFLGALAGLLEEHGKNGTSLLELMTDLIIFLVTKLILTACNHNVLGGIKMILLAL